MRKEKILILNVCRYEKEGSWKSLINFIFVNNENLTVTDKFKGYADLTVYYDTPVAYEQIPVEAIGQVVEVTIEEKSNSYNPLKKKTVLSSIAYKGQTYNLC